MANSAISYLPATFTATSDAYKPASDSSQADFALWEKEAKQADPTSGGSSQAYFAKLEDDWKQVNSGSSTSGSSSSSGGSSSSFIGALLPILQALVSWMSKAMEGGSSGGGSSAVQPLSQSGNAKVTGNNPAAIAESLNGRSIDSVVSNQDVKMDHGISDHEDCANFASACLVKAGEIPQSQHTNGVQELHDELLYKDGWHAESKSQVKPGDVCIVGGDQHVEIVAGIKNGKVELIGSNNTRPDGSQAVGQDSYTGNQGNVEFLSK
jgi:hypothetical protein